MKNRKLLLWLSVVGIAIIIIIAGAALYAKHLIMGTHFTNAETAYIYIDTDDNLDSVRAKTVNASHPKEMKGFDLIAKYFKLDTQILTGRYEIKSDMRMLDFMRDLRNGNQKPLMITLPSVRTIEDMCGRVTRNIMLDSASLAKMLTDTAFCSSIGYTEETLPTLFIPNTYEVYWDISLEEFIERLQKENAVFWNNERLNKANTLGMSKEEVVTLASIVDSETANNGEKPRVAGLYINRLKKGMLLQSDPTVIFATKDFTIRRVLNHHLQTESPYNTYKYKGLPPGPIRIPSIAGIDAVLNYEKHNYIYMCAKEDFSGTHNFASTYSAHLANARRYTKALTARGIMK